MLFGVTQYGLVPGKYAPPGCESDMPAFDDTNIRAALAYFKYIWGRHERAYRTRFEEQRRPRQCAIAQTGNVTDM